MRSLPAILLASILLLPAYPQKPEEASVLGALDAIAGKSVSASDVMDFLSSVYVGHDYYQTGGWDDPDENFYFGAGTVLPQCDLTDFIRPVAGKVTSGYGYRESFKRVHKGIDLSLSEGDTVLAALPGVVSRVGYDAGGYGCFIVIRHSGDFETRYGHLQGSLAVPGTHVRGGQPVAIGGNTGNSTGPHLHFETRCKGIAVDPASLFSF